MKYRHIDKFGNEYKLKELKLSHLNNIISWIERQAKEGLIISYGGSGVGVDDCWYDEYTIYGKDVKEELNYKKYKKELSKRLKQTK